MPAVSLAGVFIVQEGCQMLSHLHPGPEKQALHGRQRHLQHFTDLLIRHLLMTSKHNGEALFFRKRRDRLLQRLLQLLVLNLLVR